jgi:choline dehydrogenase-like flavoprotein
VILDARDTSVSLDRRATVAIVGAGPAGLTLARELGRHVDVLVVESGGLAADPQVQALCEGESVGIDYPLSATRARQFGGSTALWSGYCALFDAHDFAPRPWVPWSGWPFGIDALSPYFARAAESLNLGAAGFDAAAVARGAGMALPLGQDPTTVSVWRYGEPALRCGVQWRQAFDASRAITVLTHANLTDLLLDGEEARVAALALRTLTGRSGRVEADIVVLACGGIETPRILLNADRQLGPGVANRSGLVGRFFMEHPHVEVAAMRLNGARSFSGWVDHLLGEDAREFMLALGVSASAQAAGRILNARAHVYRTPSMAPNAAPRLGIFLEQAPNPSSRVSLADASGARDALGLRRVRLDWQLTELDWVSYEETARILGREFERAGMGELVDRASPVGPRDPSRVLYTNHHLGTTRMSAHPGEGVVNADCRTHDHENLYIVGGSVYPTVSWANPTFTLMALTLRLADHLRQRLGFAP